MEDGGFVSPVPELWQDMPYPFDTESLDLACAEAWLAKGLYEQLTWWTPFKKLRAHNELFKALRKVQLIAENRSRIVVSRMYGMDLHIKS